MKEKNLSVDCCVFGLAEGQIKILLVQWEDRGLEPVWALPGEFIFVTESVEQAAARILKEWTGLSEVYLQQGKVYSDPNRFLFRVVTVSFSALVHLWKIKPCFQGKGIKVEWFGLDELPSLAFDHEQILLENLNSIREKARVEPIGLELLPKVFTLTEMQGMYETLFQKELDKRNFRKKVLSFDLLEDTGRKLEGTRHWAPKLYRFQEDAYLEAKEKGFYFEI